MNRFVSNLILGFFVVVLVIAYGVFKQPPTLFSLPPSTDDGETEQVTADIADTIITLPNGQTINTIVATSLEDRQQGLSGVESLADDAGMLFVFPNIGQHGIWMRDMKFPLDIVWLDETGKVIHVVEKAPVQEEGEELLVYQSELPAKYVLEVTAGMAKSAGIEVGDTITLS